MKRAERKGEKPLFKLGVIADVQYASHLETGWDFHHVQQRHYQFSRVCMCAAFEEFAANDVDAVLQLGDLIDGQCKKYVEKEPKIVLNELLADSARILGPERPVLHAIGNHELYCFGHQEAAELFGVSQNSWNYTWTTPCAKSWKVIVLDSYALSTLNPGTAEQAYVFLEKFNHNNVRSFAVDWMAGLDGAKRRYVPFNGALGEEQRKWLAQELDSDCHVIIATHVPIMEGSCQDSCLLWDCEEIKAIFGSCKANVVAVFAGHDHDGGYLYDEKLGIHHVTMPSPMLCKNSGHNSAHAIVNVYPDRLELVGSGSVPSRTMRFS